MNRKISVGMAVTIVILAMTVTFSITMLIAMRLFDSTVSSVKEKESMYNKVAEVDRYVRSNDYYPIDETVLYDRLTAGYLLGTGDKAYEDWFKGLAWRFPTKVSANIYFSNQLAQRIYAASDIFLMPSNYEPCGIGQLIALRYGSVPVVRETGGLKDTIIPYDKYTKQGNGFRFADYNAHEMMYALKRALSAYENYEEWKQIVENAMNSDYSWKESAREYKALYEKLTGSEA